MLHQLVHRTGRGAIRMFLFISLLPTPVVLGRDQSHFRIQFPPWSTGVWSWGDGIKFTLHWRRFKFSTSGLPSPGKSSLMLKLEALRHKAGVALCLPLVVSQGMCWEITAARRPRQGLWFKGKGWVRTGSLLNVFLWHIMYSRQTPMGNCTIFFF